MQIKSVAVLLFTSLISLQSMAERIYNFDIIGDLADWKTRSNVEAILEAGMQENAQRYKLIQVGCGTECLSYQGVVDFYGFKVYLFDAPISAYAYPENQAEPVLLEPEYVLDYEPMIVQGHQMIFSLGAGPLTVNAEAPLIGREIQSVRASADQYMKNPTQEDYVGVIVGCGTQCMTLSSVIRVRDWTVLALKEGIDAIEAFGNPKFIDLDGKKFIFNGEVLRERR